MKVLRPSSEMTGNPPNKNCSLRFPPLHMLFTQACSRAYSLEKPTQMDGISQPPPTPRPRLN